MSVYADTSFVISWFIPDANHTAAIARIQSVRGAARLPWTPWNALEFNNAARALCGRGVLPPTTLQVLTGQIRSAVSADDLVPARLPAYRWWQEAERLSKAHTRQLNVRTLDLLHVAAARTLGVREFWTFDTRQGELARAAGLRVGP